MRKSYQRSMDSMARLNRTAARLMHKYNAHGSTDITGKNFEKFQYSEDPDAEYQNTGNFGIPHLLVVR